MKYLTVLSILILFACGCNRNEVKTKLLNEQAILKDRANKINERIGNYLQKGAYDSAEAEKKQLEVVYERLITIQSSIDHNEKLKMISKISD